MVTNIDQATAGVRGTNCHVTRGRECLRATRQPPRIFIVPTPARACWAKGSDRRGGQSGESQALESVWIHRVLVDNKSVAEIGKRHLA